MHGDRRKVSATACLHRLVKHLSSQSYFPDTRAPGNQRTGQPLRRPCGEGLPPTAPRTLAAQTHWWGAASGAGAVAAQANSARDPAPGQRHGKRTPSQPFLSSQHVAFSFH